MTKLLTTILFALAACTDDSTPTPIPELYDPTGTWDLTLTWGAGTCGATGMSTLKIIVAEARGEFVAATDEPTDTVTGTVLQTETSARIDLDIADRAQTVLLSVVATAGAAGAITGSGDMLLTQTGCTQQHADRGTLR